MLHAQQNYQLLYKTASNAGNNYPMFQSFADFNNDGKTDFLLEERFPGPSAFNGNCKVYEFTGSGYTQKQLLTIPPYSDAYTANYGWDNQSSSPGQFSWDADNDGTRDLLIAGANGADCGGNFVRIYWGSITAPQFANNTYTQFALSSAYCVGSYFVDYDNDGFKDVYIRNAGGVNMMYHNNGNRTFTQVPTVYPGRDLKALWDDYDQDGYQDFCYLKYGGSDAAFGLRLNKGLGTGNFGPTISNFDAERPMYFIKIQSNPLVNNSPDIVFNCMSDGTDYRRIYVAEWSNTTHTFNATHFDVQPGNNSVIPIRALDYNLDGYDDIILRYRIGTTIPARFNLVAVINDGYGNFTHFDTIVSNVLWTPGECYKVGPDLHISGAYDHTLGGGGEDSLYVFGKPLNGNTPLSVSITITATEDTVCQGTAVNFTAVPVNGGSAPAYQWKVNGVNAGGNSSVFSYIPGNMDVVTCILTSNAPGATGNPATSNAIHMTVNPSIPVSVSITASANPVCQGTSVTFTATPVNGGPNGFLQWYVNGLPVSGGGSVTNGLVAHYPFDGNTVDATGNSQNAVPHGNVSPTTDRMGNPNSAYYIGGNSSGSDYLTVANSTALAVRNPFTESIWINKEVHGGIIVMKGRDIVNGYGLYDAGGHAMVVYGVTNGAFILNTSVSLNQWHLYTCVFKGDSASFYLDGLLASKELMPSANYVSTSTDYPMVIGRHFTYCCYNPDPSYWSYPYKGKVDDLRLYNRALTAAEVLQLFQGSSTTYTYVPQDGDVVTCVLTASGGCLSNNPDTSNAITMIVHPLPADIGQTGNITNGLLAYYPLNGNATDASGNGKHGILKGVYNFAAGQAGQSLHVTGNCGNPNSCTYGNGGHVMIPTENFNSMPSFTLSIWAKEENMLDPDGEGYLFFGKHFGAHVSIGHFSNTIQFDAGTQGVTVNYSSSYLNAWTMYSFVVQNGMLKAFINGTPVGTAAIGPVNLTLDSAAIGKHWWYWESTRYTGSLDDARIYSRALSDTEIMQLYGFGQPLSVAVSNDSICTGASTALQIINSQPGIKYQLYKNNVAFGTFQVGTGSTLTFPITGLTQTSNFTITAINTATTCGITLDSTFTVHVSAFNATFSANTSLCSGSNATLTASGGTNYTWSNGMMGSSITVAPVVTTTYYVTVTNAFGCSDNDSIKVTVLPRPAPTVTGPNTACFGATNNSYTTQAGMSGYSWTVSSGGTITSGAGTNTVTVTWNVLGAQNISVSYTNGNGCIAAAPGSIGVTVNPMPAPSIAGSNSLCVNSGYYDYQTEAGMVNYQWTISAGGTITFGQGTNQVQVLWSGAGSQWVRVNYSNSSGCTTATPAQYNITVKPLPGPAGTVTGPQAICAGASGTYSTGLIQDALTYVWSLPVGATIVSGEGTNSIVVNFGANATTGQVSVYGNNLCGNGTASPALTVGVAPLPWPAGDPVGESNVCVGDTSLVYYVTPILGATSYMWNITNGGVITSGNGTNSIRAKFPVVSSAPCEITVYGINACGNGTISTAKSVTVNPIPETPVITLSGNGIQSSSADGNQWYYNGTLIIGADQPMLIPDKSGEYYVIVTLDGCPSDTSNVIYFIMTGITERNPFSVDVFPVPNDGVFTVHISSRIKETVTVNVFNTVGVKIGEERWNDVSGDVRKTIDLRPVASGVYMLVIESPSYRELKRIMVQR